MIDTLAITRTAYFYAQKSRITDKAIDELFRDIRRQAVEPGQNVFRHDRERIDGARWSAICFAHHRDPAFLDPPPRPKERIYGFLLIVEHQGKVAVIKSGLSLTTKFKADHLDRLDASLVEGALAHSDAIFEKIRLRNLSPSKHVLRSKMLESSNLENVVGPSASSRYAPQAFALRRDDGYYSATPSTGRIVQRSDVSDYEEAVRWCMAMIEELGAQNAQVSPFLRTFAKAVSLATQGANLKPTYFTVNTSALAEDLIDEGRTHRLVREINGRLEELAVPEVEALLGALETNLSVRKVRSEVRLYPEGQQRQPVGQIKINKNRISLRSLSLADAESLIVERADVPLGGDQDAMSLRSYINSEDYFIILFDDLALSYIGGTLYRDDQLAAGGEQLLRYLHAHPGLAATTGEKGNFVAGQATFDDDSVFGVIVSHIARQDDVLLCDDLNDEWADFIGLDTRSTPPAISFYHAKHGALSLGASPFHVAISQALKNLGRMSMAEEEMPRKIASWSASYANDNVVTAINRVMRGDMRTVADVIGEVRATPDTVRRVYIVTSSLSRRQVADTLTALQEGTPPPPHFVQLYWLLMSFVSACIEVGAFGRIICRD